MLGENKDKAHVCQLPPRMQQNSAPSARSQHVPGQIKSYRSCLSNAEMWVDYQGVVTSLLLSWQGQVKRGRNTPENGNLLCQRLPVRKSETSQVCKLKQTLRQQLQLLSQEIYFFSLEFVRLVTLTHSWGLPHFQSMSKSHIFPAASPVSSCEDAEVSPSFPLVLGCYRLFKLNLAERKRLQRY